MGNGYFHLQKQVVEEFEQSLGGGSNKSSIVEVQKDYANDNQLCLSSISFVPKDLAAEMATKIMEPLQAIEPDFYYYPVNSLHLSIKNIRTIHNPPLFTEEDIKKVAKLFGETVPQFPSLHFEIEDIIKMPTSVLVIAYAEENFKKLFLALDYGLKEIGVPDDKRYFSDSVVWGSITLCRFTHQPKPEFIDKVRSMRHLKFGEMVVSDIKLVVCNAVCHEGSRRTIASFHLKA
jgi:2'-5' RNA ligase